MRLQEILEAEELPSVKTYTPAQIAKKHGVSVDKIKSQLKKGTRIELEHTTDESKAREIALDHLLELPDYYDRLEKVEEAEMSWEEITADMDLPMMRREPSQENLRWFLRNGRANNRDHPFINQALTVAKRMLRAGLHEAPEMKLHDQYDNENWGERKKVRKEQVTVKSTKTGKVYGRRTIAQKKT